MIALAIMSANRIIGSNHHPAFKIDQDRERFRELTKDKVVIYSHAWRNALIPIVTLVVGWFLSIFSGSVVIEQIFAINGMGRIMIEGLRKADFDIVTFMQLFYVVLSLLGNLIIDILYGLVDPRVRVNK